MRGDSDFSPDVCVGQGVGVGKLEGGLSFYLGSPAELRAGCRARGAAEVPGGGGGSAAAAAPPGAPADSGRGLRMGSARSPRKKLQHPNTKKPPNKQKISREREGNGKVLGGGAAGKALAAAGRAAARRWRGRGCGESPQRGEPPRGPPGSAPGRAPRKVGAAMRPRRSASRWWPFGAAMSARRFGDRLSVAIKIKINSY